MPEGQFTGNRERYIYVMDDGREVSMTLDATLALGTSGLVIDDGTGAAGGGVSGKPDRFKPRGVYWQATDGVFIGRRKFLVCGTNDAALYTATARQVITIDGVAGVTTGRRGERFSY